MLVRSGERRVLRRPRSQPRYDDFDPPVEWVQEPSYYILRLYLPQVFRKEDLNIVHDDSGKVTVRGRRMVGENRFSRFESSYNVPKDSNLEKISGKLENNVLSLTIPKIVISKPSEEKKEEPVMEEKPKMVAEEKKEGDEATVPKEKPTMAEEERKEDALIKEKKEEPVMKGAMQRIDEKMKEEPVQKKPTTMEEKKEEPATEEKSKTVTEGKKEEEGLKEINKKPVVPKEKLKPTMAEEERIESAVLKEMKEAKKTEMSMGEKIKESAAMKETTKEPKLEERKGDVVQNEIKEEPTVKEKLENLEEKNEAIQKDKLEGFDTEKKEDSTKKEETWEDVVTEKSRYLHERDVQKKQLNEKESRKRRWLWNEEDKGWLDWLDSPIIEEVLKKIYKNKKCITLALVAFSTGYYISRKMRTRG